MRTLLGSKVGSRSAAFAAVLVGAALALATTPIVNEDAQLTASDVVPSDLFGGLRHGHVAISGDVLVVTAYQDDDDGTDSGSAYVFERNGAGGWTETAKLTASDAAAGDLFGWSVATSGDRIVVGSIWDEHDGLTKSGAAYVFEPDGSGGWTETAKLTASNAQKDNEFGYSVAVSGDTIVVGSPNYIGAFVAEGRVYVYQPDGSGGWSEVDQLQASDRAAVEYFGHRVVVDGDTIAASTRFGDLPGMPDAGSAYVFAPNSAGGWDEAQKLTASDAAAGDLFGYSLALSADTIAVGAYRHDDGFTDAGATYVFVRDGAGVWSQQAELLASDAAAGDRFGWTVGISGDLLVVGAPNVDELPSFDVGRSYVFERDGAGAWSETTRLRASNATAADAFGAAVALSGTTGVVSTQGADTAAGSNYGAAYVFELTPPNDAPVADAGPGQTVHPVVTVSLDGTGSMDDQTAAAALIYAWTLTAPAGSSAALDDPTSATPSFTADILGSYTATLVVTDEGGLSSAPDSVVVATDNSAPSADAGTDQAVSVGSLAVLDGSGSSDPDGDGLTYAWTLDSAPVGSTAALTGAATAAPTLTPDLEGPFVINLVVSDGFASSVVDTVEIVSIGPVFAQTKLGDACDLVAGLPNGSFDAKGHRKSMCNDYARIIKFIQKGQTSQAVSHLNAAIERVDGCTLRNAVDPKGAGQPHAADYIVVCTEQEAVYALLTAALNAL